MKDNVEHYNLKNDLPVLYMPVHEHDTYSLMFGVRAGSLFEKKGREGWSHFLEHMLFVKTRTFKTSNDFPIYCDQYGLSHNGMTADDIMFIYINGYKDNFIAAIQALEELICYPEFTQENINNECKIINQEIDQFNDDLYAQNLLHLLKNETDGHYHDPLGSKESINTIDVDQLKAFWEQSFLANNSVITIAGNVDIYEGLRILNQSKFSSLPTKECFTKEFPTTKTNKFSTPSELTQSAYLSITYQIPVITLQNRLILNVLETILSGMNSSILMQIIRNREGLAYDVGGFVFTSGNALSMLMIQAFIDPKNIDKTIDLITNEVIERTQTITEDQRNRAINNITSRHLRKLENTSAKARSMLIQYLTFGTYVNWSTKKQQLNACTTDVLNDFAKEFLKNPKIHLFGNI